MHRNGERPYTSPQTVIQGSRNILFMQQIFRSPAACVCDVPAPPPCCSDSLSLRPCSFNRHAATGFLPSVWALKIMAGELMLFPPVLTFAYIYSCWVWRGTGCIQQPHIAKGLLGPQSSSCVWARTLADWQLRKRTGLLA